MTRALLVFMFLGALALLGIIGLMVGVWLGFLRAAHLG